MNKYFLLFFIILFGQNIFAQIGGKHVYEFLNFSSSARITGLGGNLISVKDDDVALAFANPSTLNPSMHSQVSFNHNIFLAGINYGYVSYGHFHQKSKTSLHGGIQYVSYGKFDQTDEYMNILGTFKASEYALTVGASRQIYEKVAIGANIKVITSQLESYNSFGIAADLGAFYQDTSGRFSATLLFKNIGTQISSYVPNNREPIPFEIQLGLSQRLKHLPFRLGVIFHNLQRWNVLYDDPNSEETTLLLGDVEPKGESGFTTFIDNTFRHIIFNGEFLFGKKENLRIRFGYNHFQRQELSVSGLRTLAGFSFGVGMKIKKFRIEYGRRVYHLAGGGNHISISANIGEFKKR